jgi:hypothetical protein
MWFKSVRFLNVKISDTAQLLKAEGRGGDGVDTLVQSSFLLFLCAAACC